jgi:hypothetical protein
MYKIPGNITFHEALFNVKCPLHPNHTPSSVQQLALVSLLLVENRIEQHSDSVYKTQDYTIKTQFSWWIQRPIL